MVTAGLDGATAFGGPGLRMVERAPIAWQDLGGLRVAVATRFAVSADGTVSFVLPDGYDTSQPLTLDPTLLYASYLGGSGEDDASARDRRKRQHLHSRLTAQVMKLHDGRGVPKLGQRRL